MSPLKSVLVAVAVAALSCTALAACATHGSSTSVGTTSTTGGLLCPNGYVPAADGKTCELQPLPPER